MRKNRWVAGLTLMIVGALGGAAAVVVAQVPVGPRPTKYGPLRLQAYMATREAVTTLRSEFQQIPGLSGVTVCRAYLGTSATISLELTGGPAELRVRETRGPEKSSILAPGKVILDPMGGTNSFSFTFHKSFGRPSNAEFDVEWRANNASSVTMNKGDIQILHGRKKGDKRGCS